MDFDFEKVTREFVGILPAVPRKVLQFPYGDEEILGKFQYESDNGYRRGGAKFSLWSLAKDFLQGEFSGDFLNKPLSLQDVFKYSATISNIHQCGRPASYRHALVLQQNLAALPFSLRGFSRLIFSGTQFHAEVFPGGGAYAYFDLPKIA